MPARFPSPAEELALHEQVTTGDPIAPVALYERFMDPATTALRRDLRCSEDEAYDSAIDAILIYLESPSLYDRNKGRLSTYLVAIAKRKAIDRIRSRTAERKREAAYAEIVELRATDPNDEMGVGIEAREIWQIVEQQIPSAGDRNALKLILAGERSTELLANALGMTGSTEDMQAEVKRNRDRLLKILERLGVSLGK